MPALVSEMSAKSMEEASVKFLVLIFLLAIFKLHLGEEGLREGTVLKGARVVGTVFRVSVHGTRSGMRR